jgi:hypothetical protein
MHITNLLVDEAFGYLSMVHEQQGVVSCTESVTEGMVIENDYCYSTNSSQLAIHNQYLPTQSMSNGYN